MVEENCVICLGNITDPVCTACYSKQLVVWFKRRGVGPLARELVLEEVRDKLSRDTLSDEKCILCNSESISVCYYCFFRSVGRVVKSLNLPTDVKEEFAKVFSYRTMTNSSV